MITQTLATTQTCRNGNCPTVWATDTGTVIIQGYVAGDGCVRVPTEILERAATQLPFSAGPVGLVPAPRASEPVIARDGDDFLVRGDPTTPDIAALNFPANEAAVELAAAEIAHAAHREREAV